MTKNAVDAQQTTPLRKVTFVAGRPDAEQILPSPARKSTKSLSAILLFFTSLLIAGIVGVALFLSSLFTSLVSVIINIGLDPLRSQMVTALIMTAGASLVGAALSRKRLSALIGSLLVFLGEYLIPFVYTEVQPLHDPGGLLEPLNTDTLVRTVCVMLALGILSAFIGGAIGENLGEVLFVPPFKLVYALWQFISQKLKSTPLQNRTTVLLSEGVPGLKIKRKETAYTLVFRWVGMAGMAVVLVLVSNSGDLFLFSPDVGLHTVPVVHNRNHINVPSHGTLVQGSLVSGILHNQSKPLEIYLPPSYNTPEGKNKYYPTLYLLHGSPGTDIDWVKGGKVSESADTLIDAGKMSELIIVMPDGNGRKGATSEWGNSFDQQQMIETYVTTDVVHYIDMHYRTIPDSAHRAIGGLSMGAFGATNIAVHHPGVFGTVISLGGYYTAEGSIWGKNKIYMNNNSPLYTILQTSAAWKLHMYLGAATKDQPYYTDTKQFMQELEKLHVPYTFDLETGYHSWPVWQTQMYKALLWLQWDDSHRLVHPDHPKTSSIHIAPH